MSDEEIRIFRIYQYLLAKDVQIKQKIVDRHKLAFRKHPHTDDVLAYYLMVIKAEFWEEIAGEIWNLIK